MCNRYSYLGSIALSIILAIIIGALFFFGIISDIQTILIVSLVFAIINFIIFLILSIRGFNDSNKCRCKYIYGIIVGILVSIFLIIFALGITLVSGSILSAIFIGVIAFFISFMFINILLFLLCLNEDCRCNCSCSCNCT